MRRSTAGLLLLIVLPAFSANSADANPAAAGVAKFLGEYLISKGLDAVWDSATGTPDVGELQSRLSAYEHALARVDADLSQRIGGLRREVDQKTTPAQVRAIVRQTLRSLEDRIQAAEGRLDTIDARIKAIEDVFGFLPTVAPAPLLRSSVLAGRPEAHPLVVEWITLLCDSEVSRRKLIELRRDYRETSKTVKEAVAADQKILAASSAIHQKATADLAEQLQERELLLLELKPTHPKVRAFDDRMASLLWLVAVTRPIEKGEQKGRLPVPRDMLGPAASDILVAFNLAGADVKVTASLYRRLLADVFHGEDSWTIGATSADLDDDTKSLLEEAEELSRSFSELQVRISQTDAELRVALAKFSEAHETVLALRKRQAELIVELHRFHDTCDASLTKAMSAYVALLRTQRPTNRRMTVFRQSLLSPLYGMTSVTSCRDWEFRIEQLDTWKRLVSQQGEFHGQSRGDNSLKMQFVLCPPGEFTMGDEKPVSVTLTEGFWLGKTEVTQAQWKAVMATTPWKGNENVKEDPDCPAVYVSWEDAMSFCRKLTEQEQSAGRLPSDGEYTLPTEAQWEYACRARTRTQYSFGDDTDELGGYAWFEDNADDIGEKYAHEVGKKLPNAWKLHDMHGNVWEWCRDWYTHKLPGGNNPEETSKAADRVIRGGCWGLSYVICRSTYRVWRGPSLRGNDLGFRVARSSVGK